MTIFIFGDDAPANKTAPTNTEKTAPIPRAPHNALAILRYPSLASKKVITDQGPIVAKKPILKLNPIALERLKIRVLISEILIERL